MIENTIIYKQKACLTVSFESLVLNVLYQYIFDSEIHNEIKDKIPVYLDVDNARGVLKLYYDKVGKFLAEGEEIPEYPIDINQKYFERYLKLCREIQAEASTNDEIKENE